MIQVDHVTKYYGATPAVEDLHFTIQDGECIGLLGLNGAGKSTTLRLLSTLLLPTSGRITVRGLDVEAQAYEVRKLIGYLPDTPPLYPEMTVEGFLRFAGKLRGMSGAEVTDRLPEVLRTTGLSEVEGQAIGTLSHGFKQRVGIAQAIVHRPALLILDEPMQGLDPVQAAGMVDLIDSLRGEHTILVSTHQVSLVEEVADRVLVIHRGRIAAMGSREDLIERYGDAFLVEVVAEEAAVREALDLVLRERAAPHDNAETGVVVHALADGVLRLEIEARDDLRDELTSALSNADLPPRRVQRIEPFYRLLSRLAGRAKETGKEAA